MAVHMAGLRVRQDETSNSDIGPYKHHLIQMGHYENIAKTSIQQNQEIPGKCFDSAGKIQLISQGKWTVLKSVEEDNTSGRHYCSRTTNRLQIPDHCLQCHI